MISNDDLFVLAPRYKLIKPYILFDRLLFARKKVIPAIYDVMCIFEETSNIEKLLKNNSYESSLIILNKLINEEIIINISDYRDKNVSVIY